ncbi:type II secretion system protein [Falsibacillus pallidus]|uniref:Prepilin-type N-terminal cleavage/methylation domain-containing protein n=1 Tax=Falsibacillus pallidus TaxID=493781 RepID=A0A370GQC2_9BACI|nr:type II secretion system protein [Falsibacillus pallidus]RDI44163.1 prepilin-type N-terminal cleavage/methylation domain-containing protein [Falsibacillus pallidus]
MNNQRGFTLIEVLLSITILGILAVILLQFTGFFSFLDERSDTKQKAIELANQELVKEAEEINNAEANDTYELKNTPAIQSELISINGSPTFDMCKEKNECVFVSSIVHIKVINEKKEEAVIPKLLVVGVKWKE